jgi:crotonobetainyl-CoA:carnitine CoA-transferase CaiB-like acyl-CoA transferase
MRLHRRREAVYEPPIIETRPGQREDLTLPNIMEGVRILEVAEHTFVPAASAILADWGAEVIKIEHPERGDAMRGLASSGVMPMLGPVHVLLEHSNRGKKSIGIDVGTEKGLELVYRLAASCDVFLTNKLPGVRKRLHIEAEDIHTHNPNIIYVAGTGAGERGPDADRGGYDFLSYWCRGTSAMGNTPTDAEFLGAQPAPGYGDSIGGMTIAGGILGALFHRERTGEAISLDVSLLGVGMWAMSPAIALSLQLDHAWRPGPGGSVAPFNPLVGTYRTQDSRFLAFSCLQGFRYWPSACRAIGREDLIDDERFASHELLTENAKVARDILAEVFGAAPLSEWRARLETFDGQWSFAQDTLEVVDDPQTVANGYIGETATADGVPYRLVTTPVQFGNEPAPVKRGPEFNEHCDEILASIGCGADEVIELKVAGVVA